MVREPELHVPLSRWKPMGAGVLFVARDTGRVLLGLRSDGCAEPGTWGTWGGQVDVGETPAEAAARECMEEAGYQIEPDALVHVHTYRSGSFAYFNFLAVVGSEFQPELTWETDDCVWATPGRWPAPLHFGAEALLSVPSVVEAIAQVRSHLVAGAGSDPVQRFRS
jgi:8-oxo-dGTP diphosphatase